MSDDLKAKGEALIESLVKDVKEKLPVIEKLKAMNKLAQEIGEGAPELDQVIETAESFAKMVIERFGKPKPKE